MLALAKDVYRYAYSLCRNQAQADDLTQETFLRAWRFLPNLRDDSKAKSWLFTTTRREFARQFERYQPVFVELDAEQTPALEQADMETWMIQRCINELPVKYREVLLLQAIGGFSGEEIAQALDIPRATVNTRLFRARARLRQKLDTPNSVQDRHSPKLKVVAR